MKTAPNAEKQSGPLEIALGASKPIPASNVEACRELLEVEKLAATDLDDLLGELRSIAPETRQAFRANFRKDTRQ
jgi:hypothetical protein